MKRGVLIAFVLLCVIACAAFKPQQGSGSGLPAMGSTWKGAGGGGSAPTFVQLCSANGGANPENCNNVSFPGNVTSGNCIMCMFQWGSSTLSNIADPTGGSVCNGTWTPDKNNQSIAGGNRIGAIWHTVATGTGTCNPTATWAAGNGGTTFVCHEVHGQGAGVIDQSDIFDAGNGAFAAANSLAGNTLTDTNSNDYVMTMLVLTGTPTFLPGTSPLTFTLRGSLLNVVQTEDATAAGTSARGTGSNSGGTGFGGVLTATIHP